MFTHLILTALVCGAAIYAFQLVRGVMAGAATVSPVPVEPPPVVVVPKVPSVSDTLSALAIINRRLLAVGKSADEVAALNRPLIDGIMQDVK